MSDEHQEWTPMLHGFIDGELDAMNSARFEAHLATCADCRAELERLQGMRRLIGQNGVRWRTPDDLRTRILTAIEQESAAEPASTAPTPGNGAWRRNLQFIRQWSFVPSIAALAASLMLFVSVPRQDISLEDQVLASHVRSLLADHLTDVLTSDQHTVKPWFNGKIDFSPPVVDLASKGFPLVGGRVDYLDNRVVAALVYHRHGHVINLFVWPGAPVAKTTTEHEGYNFAEWSAGGLVFWAVTDASGADLAAFRDEFSAEAGLDAGRVD